VEGADKKPRRMAWPKNLPVESADLDTALQLLSLPRVVGTHPETGKAIEANIGRFGPYLKHDDVFKSIPKVDNVHTIALARAVELLAQKKAAAGALKELGAHPDDGKPVRVYSGRYGPYVKHGKVNATIVSPSDPEKITLEEALALLEAKSGKKPAKKKPGTRARATSRRAA
jgi:DNA topoisomerase-1